MDRKSVPGLPTAFDSTENSEEPGYDRSIVLDKCRHVAIGVNTFDYNPDYTGERIDGITIRDSAGCSLSGLLLEATRAGSPAAGGAIEVFNSREIAITNCQVLDPAQRGIYLENVVNSRVSDCTVLDRRPKPTMRAAITLVGARRDNLIYNNLLGKGTEGDLVIQGGTASVAGNVVVG